MKISLKTWLIFVVMAVLCFGLWYKIGYKRFAFVNLSIDRENAVRVAEDYLNFCGINPKTYFRAAVFSSYFWPDRYLQKTLGADKEEEFLRQHNLELFSWQVRFFKELKKEEYVFSISSKTGEVLGFSHLIEDTEHREALDKDLARQKAQEFLKERYGLNLKDYDFHAESTQRYDRRMDYSFSWEKRGVYIPWKNDQGGAKLLIGATVSGDEIRGFYKSSLDIPEKFERYIQNQFVYGEQFSSFSFIFYMLLLTWSVFIVIKNKQTVAIRITKSFYIYVTIFLAAISTLFVFNNLESVIMSYSTSTQVSTFAWLNIVKTMISLVFLSVIFILPALAGESLHSEALPDNRYSAFSHYIKSTFFSRSVFQSIFLGYLVFLVLLGVQAVLFYFGRKYFGLWSDWTRLTQLSSAYLPFLSAFVIAIRASLNEEILYRLMAISWVKKYFKNTVLAVFVSSIVWGLGHTGYAVFPVWFRGIEVTALGIILGFIFLKYGIIAAIVAHYLFDAFYGTSAYLFGHSRAYLFISSLFILVLPLLYGIAAFILNRKDQEIEAKMALNSTEKYNLNILITFVSHKKDQGMDALSIKDELLRNNWDAILIDLAIGEVFH